MNQVERELRDKILMFQFLSVFACIFLFVFLAALYMCNRELTQARKETFEVEEALRVVRTEMIMYDASLENLMLHIDTTKIPLSLHKMINAARGHKKVDFDFYIRMMQEENKRK